MNSAPRIDHEDRPGRRRPLLAGLALLVAVAGVVALALFNLERTAPAPEPVAADGASANRAGAPAIEASAVPSFDVVRISRGGTGVLAGRAMPDSLVKVLLGERVIGSVRADRNGEWVMILEEPLAPGTVELSLTSQLDGQEVVASENVVVIALAPPRDEERFSEPEGEGVVALLTPRDGSGASRVMQKPGLTAPGEVGDSLTVDTIDYGGNGGTIFTGRALPRATVRLYLDNEPVGEVRASDEGRWEFAGDLPLASGERVLRLDQVIGEGKVQLRVTQPFTAGEVLDPTAAESRVIVQPGNTLWAIARQLYGRGTRYTLIFQENSEQIVDPDMIFPGQVFRFPDPRVDRAPDPQDG